MLATTYRECLAAIWAVTIFRPYLEEFRITIQTDCERLQWILTMKEATGKLARWQLRLSQFEFDITHRANVKHQATDAPSEINIKGKDRTPSNDEDAVRPISVRALACAFSPVETELKTTGEPKRLFVLFLSGVCFTAVRTYNE